MTRNTLKALLLTTLATASVGAFATESADMAIRGTIRPPACNVDLSGAGRLDLGTISANTLSKTEGTQIAESPMTMTISCEAPTIFGITTIDNRAGTLGQTANAAANGAPGQFMGLGAVNGTSVGAYYARLITAGTTGDGNSITNIYSADGGVSYRPSGVNGPHAEGAFVMPGERLHAYSITGETTPSAFSTVVQPMLIGVYANSIDTLPPLTDGVPLDGSLTFQIQYF